MLRGGKQMPSLNDEVILRKTKIESIVCTVVTKLKFSNNKKHFLLPLNKLQCILAKPEKNQTFSFQRWRYKLHHT